MAAQPWGSQITQLTDLYYAAEWGQKRDAKAEETAAALGKQIHTALRERRQSR